MSTLTRDPLAQPPLRRPASKAAARWDWPDPAAATAPPMAPTSPRRATAPQWPDEPPLAFWTPAPEPAPPPNVAPPRAAGPVVASPAPGRQPWPQAQIDPFAPLRPQPVVALSPPTDPYSRVLPGQTPFVAPPNAPPGAERSRDPSPSRLAYRMNRLWLTPVIRLAVSYGLPLVLTLAIAGAWLSSAENREALSARIDAAVNAVQSQPVFQVHEMQVLAASPEVARAVADVLGLSFPVSSFALDLEALRARAQSFDAVEQAWLQVRSGGILEVRLQERIPVMIWRHAGGLDLIDATGHRVAQVTHREARPDLPLIAGDGAPEAAAEARLLLAAALPLQPRLRGLVRVGQRRWDLVLDRDQRILLPEHGALGALERVLALDAAQQVLSRDLAVVDMRLPNRPTIRLTEGALAEVTRNRPAQTGARRR